MSAVYVYLIAEVHQRESEGKVPFKIGISSNPAGRAHDLNAGNARPLYVHHVSAPLTRLEAGDMERAAHEDLACWALGREWFHCPIEYGMDALRSVGAAT